jgi:hypothetical protein
MVVARCFVLAKFVQAATSFPALQQRRSGCPACFFSNASVGTIADVGSLFYWLHHARSLDIAAQNNGSALGGLQVCGLTSMLFSMATFRKVQDYIFEEERV